MFYEVCEILFEFKGLWDRRLMLIQEVNDKGKIVFCCIENFVDCYKGFSNLLCSLKLFGFLNDFVEEFMFLFKEKINYKFVGSGNVFFYFVLYSLVIC